MGLWTLRFVGLIATSVIMWDYTLLVETASIQDYKKTSGELLSRLPPGIVIPLPYVYPEYVDPRELTAVAPFAAKDEGTISATSTRQDDPTTMPASAKQDDLTTAATSTKQDDLTTVAPPTTQDTRATEAPSVGHIILESVRKTMAESTTGDESQPVEDNWESLKTIVQERNPNSSSVSDGNNKPMATKTVVTESKALEEMKRLAMRRPLRFGTRLRIPCRNGTDEANAALNSSRRICYQSSPTKAASGNTPTSNSTSHEDDSLTNKPAVSKVSKFIGRRTRPNVENSKNPRLSVEEPLKVKSAEFTDA